MDNISIKKAINGDIDLILPLVKLMIDYQSATEPYILNSADEIGNQNIKDHLVNLLSGNSIAVFYAKNGNEILGYVMGQIDEGGPDQKISRVGKIIDVFVLPDQRGKGVGIRLSEAIIGWFKSEGIERIELSVYSKNTNAVYFWEKLGFKEFRKNMFREL